MPHQTQHLPAPPFSRAQRLPRLEPLADRLAAALPEERGELLVEAAVAGENIELAGADLRGISLPSKHPAPSAQPLTSASAGRGISLDGVHLEGASLSGAGLAGMSLRGAHLDRAVLVGADLTGAELTGATLRGANLTGARLRRADLSFADLRGASLLTADLSEATATGADLREALLQSADIGRAMLRSADLRWSRLDGADLRGAVLDGARFEGAVLSAARLAGAHLSQSTDFSFAFLHDARFERTCLERHHLGGGVGEEFTHRVLARETYHALSRYFEATGRRSDGRWAHRKAWQMETASHRPDRSRRYYSVAHGSRTSPRGPAIVRRLHGRLARKIEPVRFHCRHTALWAMGVLTDWVSGYGTSLRRIAATLIATWLAFSVVYGHTSSLAYLTGHPARTVDVLRYSAAALTPIDAYPLVAVSEAARLAAMLEGMLGIVLLGALGYVALSRVRRT